MMTVDEINVLRCRARIEEKYHEVHRRVFMTKRAAGWKWHEATEAADNAAHEVWVNEHRKLEAEFASDPHLLALI